jgi:glycosyltransferase involved in cell wall biosynthesis
LARYLPEHGWDPIVVTPRAGRVDPPSWLIETDEADLAATLKARIGIRRDAALKDAVAGGAPPAQGARIRSWLIEQVKALIAIPDTHRGWVSMAERAALPVAGRCHAVLSTSPPVSVHLAGGRVAERTGLPWIADLRDLWWDDRNSLAPGWRRRLDRRLETRTLAGASALVTVSAPLAEELERLHGPTPVRAILNGFDPAETGLADTLTEAFTLTHTGTFYQGRRDPTLLFAAVSSLVGAGRIPRDRIRIRLFARHEPWVGGLARQHGIADLVELLPWASREQALRAQQESQVLLLLHWGGDRERGVYTGKVFEYLAACRPILMIGGGEGVLHDLLKTTGAGVHVTAQAELEQALESMWHEFEQDGEVTWRGRDELIDRYSHRRMAGEFARLLDEVCAR